MKKPIITKFGHQKTKIDYLNEHYKGIAFAVAIIFFGSFIANSVNTFYLVVNIIVIGLFLYSTYRNIVNQRIYIITMLSLLIVVYFYLLVFPKYFFWLERERFFRQIEQQVIDDFWNLYKKNIFQINFIVDKGSYRNVKVVIKDKKKIEEIVNSINKFQKSYRKRGKRSFYHISFLSKDEVYSVYFRKGKNNRNNGVDFYYNPYHNVFKESSKIVNKSYYECLEFGDLINKYVDGKIERDF